MVGGDGLRGFNWWNYSYGLNLMQKVKPDDYKGPFNLSLEN